MNLKDYMSRDPNYAKSIEGLGANEQTVVEIRKHLFGIISIYIGAAVGLLGALGLIFLLIPQLVPAENLSKVNGILGLFAVVGIIFTVILLLIATFVYKQNRLIISDRNITQVLQRGLFSRQVSELSMSNVEDITADQQGIIASLFNFGELRIETAGEQNNFRFNYCPKPNYYGKIILDARQQYVNKRNEQRATAQTPAANMPQTQPPSPPLTPPEV